MKLEFKGLNYFRKKGPMTPEEKSLCKEQDTLMHIITLCFESGAVQTVPNVREIAEVAHKRLGESHKDHPFTPEQIKEALK